MSNQQNLSFFVAKIGGKRLQIVVGIFVLFFLNYSLETKKTSPCRILQRFCHRQGKDEFDRGEKSAMSTI